LKLGGSVLGAAGLQSLLAACGAKETATPEMTGPFTIDLWSVAWGGAKDYWAGYEETYQTKGGRSDVSINLVQFPADRLPERVLLAQLAGGGPHVFYQNDVEWTKFTYTGGAEAIPLDIFEIDSYDDLNNYYTPGIVDVMKRASPDDKIYVVGQTATVYAHVYNATAFDEAGIPRPSPSEPMTWEQWAEVTSELTQWDGDTLMRSGYAARMEAAFWKEAFQNHFCMLVKQAGGKLVSDDGKTALFDSAEAVQGFQIFVDLYKKYKTITPGFVTDTVGDFETGRIVSLLTYPAYYSSMKAKDLPFEVAVAPLPVLEGGKRVTSASFAAWLVNPRGSEPGKTEAWKWLAWTVKNANVAFENDLTVWGTAIAFPNDVHEKAMSDDPNWIPFYGTQQYAEPALLLPRALEIKDVVMKAISKMIVEDVPVADALKTAKEEADAILAQPGF
jgi:multiple sugar transport system substrate-binding protein